MAETALIHFKLDQFEGPIDLLLQLIEKEKLDISEVSLAQITLQYLSYVEAMGEEIDAEDLAKFLVVASRLILLKSRTLLPFLEPMENEGPSLEEQLRMYKFFVEKSKIVNNLWQNRNHISLGRDEKIIFKKTEKMPTNLNLENLSSVMLKLISRLTPPKPPLLSKIDKIISIKERIEELRNIFKNVSKIKLAELFANKNRGEVVVTFLAILEMAKLRSVDIRQKGIFGDIIIKQI